MFRISPYHKSDVLMLVNINNIYERTSNSLRSDAYKILNPSGSPYWDFTKNDVHFF